MTIHQAQWPKDIAKQLQALAILRKQLEELQVKMGKLQ